MTEEAANEQQEQESTQAPAEETVSKAEFEKVLNKMRNLEAENVHFKKSFDGIDPEEYKALKEEKKLYDRKEAKDEQELEAIITNQLQEKYGSKIETLETNLTTASKQLREFQIVDVAMKDAAGRFNDDVVDDVKDKVRKYVDRDEEGNLFIKDDQGNRRLSPATPSKNMSVSEFMDEIATQKPSWAKAQVISGSKHGAEKNGAAQTGSFKVPSASEWAGMSSADKSAFVRANLKNGLKLSDLPS